MRSRPLAIGFVLLAITALILPSRAGAVQQWRRWEQVITSSRDFTASQGNPYRDLILRVQFTNPTTGETFTQDAFWDSVLGSPTRFKVRTALPPGTSWSWQIAGCTGSTGGQSCATGTTWTPSSGTVTVSSFLATGIRLYDRGFLMQLQRILGDGSTGYSQIKYGDNVNNFYWAGDTAWGAPAREADIVLNPAPGKTSSWASFLADRKSKGFTTVLVAPAVAWKPKPGDTWNGLPNAQGFSFNTIPGCSTANTVLPNDCSYPRLEYWNVVDNLVEQANAQDIAVVFTGLIDPVDLGKDGSYPNLANARDFARFLPARLGGNFVIFSPGFDDRMVNHTQDGLKTVQDVITAVGPDIRAAAPRHLVTNHLAGASTCTDYQTFKGSGWMTFYMFQSGHAGNQNATTGECLNWISPETRAQSAMRRAREMPLTLSTYTHSSMPNINGEGPYDGYPSAIDPDTRYRVRQAGHLSSLSNAQGFTYGVTNMGIWDNPGTYFGLDSSKDMQQLFVRFKDRAGLPAKQGWILNQVAAPNHEKMMVLASDSSSLVLGYLPGDSGTMGITIDTTSLPGLVCGGTWTMKWINPITNLADMTLLGCVQGTSRITVNKPVCLSSNVDCDWVLELQRTGAALVSPALSPSTDSLDLWADFSNTDGTSAIYATIKNPGLSDGSAATLISPAGRAFQQSPRVAHNGDGYFVVWHGDGLDGSLYGVFARKIDRRGGIASDPFQVNTYSQHDQRDPAVASDPSGNVVVVWSSYGQDGDLGGIYGQRFDRFGNPAGGEFAINTHAEGHQAAPQVAFDAAGNFIVAWSTEAGADSPSALSFRRFSRTGQALSDEVRISPQDDFQIRLVDLQVSALGDFAVRWTTQDLLRRSHGQFLQQFDAAGRPTGSAAPVNGAD